MKKLNYYLQKYPIELFLLFLGLLFSTWLMFSTFSYKDGNMLIASRAWSDFASHIPLIRSFSYGANFPVEYPLFPGQPIKYHFAFYALAALLEKIGLRIDYGLNIPSALGFFALLIMIYKFSGKLLRSKAAAVLSVLLFLFNGTFSFLYFFAKYPLSFKTPANIWNLTSFPSFGPYDGKIVSAFWNLNIYTNQRHLGLSFALGLFILYQVIFTKKRATVFGIIIFLLLAALFFLNEAVFFIIILSFSVLVLSDARKNFKLLTIILLAALLMFLYNLYIGFSLKPAFSIGFLSPSPVTVFSFLYYWFMNLGLYAVFIPLSFLFVKKRYRFFFAIITLLFVLANTIKFSPDMINNHKLINFIFILGSIFTSGFIVKLWNVKRSRLLLRTVSVFAVVFLTLSGVIDLMPIKNDYKIALADIKKNSAALFFVNNTFPSDVVLNTTSLYNPASIAGRKIFYGYSYFAWSYGYDTLAREKIVRQIYASRDKATACRLLAANNIAYVELNENPNSEFYINTKLWNTFSARYSFGETKILKVGDFCK